jgi:transcriptional regulator of nitric oxide reductase
LLIALVWLAQSVSFASAQSELTNTPPLLERLTPQVLHHIFPQATRVEMVSDNGPAAAAAYADSELIGYAFSTLDVLRAPGYSSTPFDAVAGVTLDGHITGAALLFHREPYLLDDDHRTGLMYQFLDNLVGMEARLGAPGGLEPGFVAGATISARAMRAGILESAGLVLGFRTGAKVITEPTVDVRSFHPKTVEELIADGSVAEAVVTNAGLAAAMEKAGLGGLPPEVPTRGGPDEVYLDFRVAYAAPPTIGRNMAGQAAFQHIGELPAGSQALLFGSDGFYDHLGSKYNNLSHGFRLERIAVLQGDRVYQFYKSDIQPIDYKLGRIATMLVLPPGSGFDPMEPWRADVYAYARRDAGLSDRFLLASVTYQLPPQHILLPGPEPIPVWMEAWIAGKTEVIVLSIALVILTLIFVFQSALSRSRVAHRWVRNAFLLFTLVWLGWTASAQLSIVNLLNYLQAPFRGFGIGFYLAEPLIVMISIYTAVSLVLLGRGVFCGWLCPFGALQELLAQVARALRLPQWNPSQALQQRLWGVKYVALAIIVGLAFLAPDAGAVAEEVEPFKTAITAIFVRGLPYVIYAVGLLAIGLFTERAFCRFLCPLGAALAILDRLHLVDLLKRRPECGSPCHLCERSCPVRAIERSGKIKMAECFQCLDCMVEYYDDKRCPPLAQQRKLRERAGSKPLRPAIGAGTPYPAPVPGQVTS